MASIDKLIKAGASLEGLSSTQYKNLLVVAKVYRQQEWMYFKKVHRISDRIVSLSQPHIRPIVRGKAGVPVEFGAKISASIRDGFVFLDHISWDNFNEAADLKAQIEAYYSYTGVYPESVHVDRIYRTRENRAFCKERGIRINGPPLGRPPVNINLELKKQAQEDERVRNAIEGKFGISKRRLTLSRVMAKLPHTSFHSDCHYFSAALVLGNEPRNILLEPLRPPTQFDSCELPEPRSPQLIVEL